MSQWTVAAHNNDTLTVLHRELLSLMNNALASHVPSVDRRSRRTRGRVPSARPATNFSLNYSTLDGGKRYAYVALFRASLSVFNRNVYPNRQEEEGLVWDRRISRVDEEMQEYSTFCTKSVSSFLSSTDSLNCTLEDTKPVAYISQRDRSRDSCPYQPLSELRPV